jgi:hypothetical protein
MKMLLFFFLLFNLPKFGCACTCFSISKKEAKRISKEADYVVLGHATENIHPNDTIKGDSDSLRNGVHVKFKVEKVYKGDLNTEFIFINQFESDCRELFEFGKNYVIVGTRIKEFENLRPISASQTFRANEIFETFQTPPPRPIGGPTINKMKVYNEERLVVDYWNEIAKNEIVIYTDQCSTFDENSTYGKYFAK